MQQSENAPLAGRVAVVTGASRGIGAAIARRLTRAGACVVIDYVSNDERARQCAQRIMDDCDAAGRVITCKADVTDAEQVRGMVSTTVTTFGGLDILVNNAFAHYSFDPRNRKTFGSIGWPDYAAQLEGCLKGAYNTCEAVLPQMRRQAGGRIINISSNLVDSPIVPYHDYTAAKGALVGFTRSLAQEAIRVGPPPRTCASASSPPRRLEGSPPPRTSPAPWPCSRETMPRSSRDRPCMSTAVW